MTFLFAQAMTLSVVFPISFVQATLGGTIAVPTLEESEKIKIPRGTQTGRTFRLKGKGIPRLQGYGRGDQIIEVFVQIPTELTRKQEELLREFEKAQIVCPNQYRVAIPSTICLNRTNQTIWRNKYE